MNGEREAIFLDRDGTIIEDRGYLRLASEVHFIPGAVEALKRLQRRFRLFIVTNQSGVAKGVTTLRQVQRVNGHVLLELHRDGIFIEETYVCPHAREQCCRCHKPEPFFMQEAAKRYGLDLDRCWSVGDHPHDAELARRVGGRGVYVLTGHGEKHRHEVPHDVPVAADLSEASRIILNGALHPVATAG